MPRFRYRRAIAFAAAVCPLVLLAANVAAQTNVYRCTTPEGAVEFRQLPCAEGSDEESVIIEDRKTGWTPAATEKGTKSGGTRRKREKKSSLKTDSSRSQQEERCWNKRQLLEDVNWSLRRGYKASQGIKLRRKRQTYEDYIGHYCR